MVKMKWRQEFGSLWSWHHGRGWPCSGRVSGVRRGDGAGWSSGCQHLTGEQEEGERTRACRRPAGEKEGLGHRWQARCLGGIFWQVSVVSLATCVFCSHFVLLERCLTCSLLRYNAHTIKVTISKCTVFWYTCEVVQLSPQSNSRTFSSHLQRCPIPISSHSLFPLPSAPGNH